MAISLKGYVHDGFGVAKVGVAVEAWWHDGVAFAHSTITDAAGMWVFAALDETKQWRIKSIAELKVLIIDGRSSIQLTNLDLITALTTDTINEHTAAAGVTIGGAGATGPVVIKAGLVDGVDVSALAAQSLMWGDGSDGNVTIASNTDLSRDMFYNNLTVNTGIVLNPSGYRIFVKETLTNNGTIARNWNTTTTYVGGAALSAGSLGGSSKGGNGGNTNQRSGGGSGGGVVFIAAKTIVNNGAIQANGGAGCAAYGGGGWYGSGVAGDAASPALGGAGGVGGGSGEYTGGAGGSATPPSVNDGGFRTYPQAVLLHTLTGTKIMGSTGGGGGGINDGNQGGGAGGGGGVLVLCYAGYSGAGTKTANGGAGGAGSGTGTAGATGSAGVVITLA